MQPGLFDEEDEKGKIRPLPKRTGVSRLNQVQRQVAGDPRLVDCLDVLKQAIDGADLEALIWAITCTVWWLTREQAAEVGEVIVKLLSSAIPTNPRSEN